MTTILCLRHAHADDGDYPDDKLRPLAEVGRRAMEKGAVRIKQLGYIPDVILHSPFLRAKETAQIVAKVTGAPLQEEKALGHPFHEATLLHYLQTEGKGKTVLFVGHNPTLASFTNRLLGANRLPLGLAKGECVVVDFQEEHDYGRASFVEMISPI